MLLWQVDDTPHWHEVTRLSLGRLENSGLRSEHFHSAQASLQAWDAAVDGGGLPDILLMDFYIGTDLGNDLTRLLRQSEPAGHHCCIVGHSSVPSCSEAIRAAGGDLVVAKHADAAGINPSLLSWLRDFLATRP